MVMSTLPGIALNFWYPAQAFLNWQGEITDRSEPSVKYPLLRSGWRFVALTLGKYQV